MTPEEVDAGFGHHVMTVLGAIVIGETEAILLAVCGAALFFLLGWLFSRWQRDRSW